MPVATSLSTSVRRIHDWRVYCPHCNRKADVMAADEADAIDEAQRRGWEFTEGEEPALLCTVCITRWRKEPS